MQWRSVATNFTKKKGWKDISVESYTTVYEVILQWEILRRMILAVGVTEAGGVQKQASNLIKLIDISISLQEL